MTRSLRAALTLFAALGLAGMATSEARADCPPNARFCAEVRVGGGYVPPMRGGQVVITVGPVPQPAPYVVVRPPPPPPVVVVRPAPPPVYVVRQQPTYVTYAPARVYVQGRNVSGTMGLRFYAAGAGGRSTSVGGSRLGGVGMALRIRPTEKFALDLGVGVYGGSDYYGRQRLEVPVTVDALYFVNPQNRVQFYLLGGVGASFAYGQSVGLFGSTFQHAYNYVGAEAGAGLEFRLTRGFALNMDVRSFIRAQPNGAPEFQRTTATGVETTRTSAGAVGTMGATLYF